MTARLDNAGGTGVTVEAGLSANASSITGLNGKYTVKVDNNGYVSGFGLASDSNNGTPVSSFIILADKFSVVTPGQAAKTPFIVDGTTGVIMDVALIKDATITNAKIASLATDKLTAGTILIGSALIADLAVTSAKIADTAITTAKIADAQITTLKIGSNAVTVPVGVRGSSPVSYGYSFAPGYTTQWADLLSASISSLGQPVMVIASVYMDSNINLRVIKQSDGSVLAPVQGQIGQHTFQGLDSSPAATETYKLQYSYQFYSATTGSGTVTFTGSVFSLLGCKR